MKQVNESKLAYHHKKVLVAFLAVGIFVLAIIFTIFLMAGRKVNSNLVLFENNEVKAVLIICDQGDMTDIDYKYITDAAELIRKHFQEATGYELPQFMESEFRSFPEAEIFAGKIKVYLGWNGLNPHPDLSKVLIELNAEAENDGNHGYVFAPYIDNVVIQSPTALGVRYGAAAFLRRYLDVEWLMPGPYGADTPKWDKVSIPQVLEFSAPAFNMRYAYCEKTDVDWLLNQGLQLYSHTKMGDFSHALYLYFNPEKYFEKHPEYYPIVNGEHYCPVDAIGWQPRFSESGTVDVAANEIIALLKNNPDLVSVSLGVNDSGGYCEQELAQQMAIHGLNSEGLVHMTDLFCKWSNAVIEKVLAEFPGRNIKFGMIAYRNLNDPPKEPGLKFHENMIPYITKDRFAWIDSDQKTQGHQITLEWLERCTQLGWYNYEYGSIYLVPRIYNTTMQEYMQFAQDNGIRYIFSEALFSIDEGAKPHLFAMLNWNPQCSLLDLEKRWYLKAVGSQAAPHLESFYKIWEEIWANDIPKSKWFENCKNYTYLHFGNFDYLDGIPLQKLEIARQHLDNAWMEVQKSGNDNQKKRMEAIRKIYGLQEATVYAYPHSYDELSQTEALKMLADDCINQQQQMRERAISIYSALLNEVDSLINRPTYYFQEVLEDERINPSPFWAIVDYIENNEPDGGTVTERVLEWAGSLAPSYGRDFCRLIVERLLGKNMILDPSFEESPLGELSQDGGIWLPYISDIGTLSIIENQEFSKKGSRSIKAENNRPFGALTQFVPVKPGLFTFRMHYYTPIGSRPDAVLWLIMDLIDSEGNVLQDYYSWDTIYGLKESPGKWMEVKLLFEVPEFFKGEKVEYIRVWAALEEQNDVPLYWDDAEAYQTLETKNLDTLISEINAFEIERPSSYLYTEESWNNLRSVFNSIETRFREHYLELTRDDIEKMFSTLQTAKEKLEPRTLELIETECFEKIELENTSRMTYHLKHKGTITLFEAELGFGEQKKETDMALGCLLMENQSYPENFAAYNSLDITSYFQNQFQHKYLSFRLSNASESGNSYYLHSHNVKGCEPRIVIKNKDGSKLVFNATNGLEVRTLDKDLNYNNISSYDWIYTLYDASGNIYNSVIYLIFDLTECPEVNMIDYEMISSVNLEISMFFGGSFPHDPPLIRVTGLYDYPGKSRWNPETITWNSQPEISLNNSCENYYCAIFRVFGDGKIIYEIKLSEDYAEKAQLVSVDISDVKELVFETENVSACFSHYVILKNIKIMHYNHIE